MTNVEKAQQRREALRQERDALFQATQALEVQQKENTAQCTKLYAKAERSPSPEADAEVKQAEQVKESLARQLGRKYAALGDCERELAAATKAVKGAEQAATLDQLQGIVEEIGKLAAQLDKDPAQPQVWGQVGELSAAGNSLWLYNLGQAQPGRPHGIFGDPRHAAREVFGAHSSVVFAALGVRDGSYREPPLVADALELPYALGNIRTLRNGAT